MELVLGLVIGIVALAVIRTAFKWVLKLWVYKLSAVLLEGVVRTVA